MYEPVNKNIIQGRETPKGWDLLINEAEDRIRELEEAIEHFRKNKANGEPYFGELGARFQPARAATSPPHPS